MRPIETYQSELKHNGFVVDPAQKQAINALQQLYDDLLNDTASGSGLIRQVTGLFTGSRQTPVTGLYIWGDVGRGKTWLMNLLYEALPFEQKLRLHFHHFMLDVHEKLASLQMRKNPLTHVARQFAADYRVVFLDEFIVTNITDAMLLSGLLEALFNNGVTLVATSNRIPDDLYKNGLQRDRFLPAIKLIEQHTRVLHLDGGIDHRIALLEKDDIYYTPITVETRNQLEQRMRSLAPGSITENHVLTIHKRPVKTVMHADEIAWFEFDALCDSPRAAPDYIQLARDYHTIILSNVPVMDEETDDKARRFIYLIDELYDRRVKLVISADAAPEKLYTGEMLKFAFKRTSSRLVEMRSNEYLEEPHLN
ncbi:MAG: AFG1 family ATPase [Thiotrichales bacterium]|nr:MAG: AFG1 family ATPase [Thiotrichales bacterium]